MDQVGYISKVQLDEADRPLYRMVTRYVSGHLYVAGIPDDLALGGYRIERIEGYCSSVERDGWGPLYRIVPNWNLSDHIYTTSISEKQILLLSAKYDEGIECYVACP